MIVVFLSLIVLSSCGEADVDTTVERELFAADALPYKIIPQLNYQLMNKRQHIHRFGIRINSIGRSRINQYLRDDVLADSLVSSHLMERIAFSADYEYMLRFMRKSDFFIKPYLGFGGSFSVDDITFLPGVSSYFLYTSTKAQLSYRMIPGARAEFKKGFFIDLGLVLNLADVSFVSSSLLDPTIPLRENDMDSFEFDMPLNSPEHLLGMRLGLGVWL